jgi:hypothetical protein
MARPDTPAHRAIAWTGWAFAVIGLIGLVIVPHLALIWAFLIAFGLAALPRAVFEWWRDRRRGRQH